MTVTPIPFRPYDRMSLAELRHELAQWNWLIDAANGERWDDHAIVMRYRDAAAAEIGRRERGAIGRAA